MTPIFRSLLGLLLFALVTPTLRAQLTLEACYQLAEQHYPLVRQTDLLRQTEALTLDNIARAWRPQVVASAQATVQSDVAQWPENLTAMMQGVGMTAPQGIARDQYKFAVQIDQLLYDGGATRQQKAVAQAETAVAQSGVAVELYALRQRVAQLFFGLLLIDQQLDNHRVLQSVLADNHRKALAQQRGGVAPGQVVTLLEAEQITAQQGELALQSQRRALQRLLATFLGRDTAALGTLVCPPERSLALDENHRPELRQFDARAALLHQRETQLATALRPRISAFAQGWYGYPGLNLFHDMQSRAWSLNGIVGVRAVWDLSRLYTYRNDRTRLALERQSVDVARQTFLLNQQLQSTQQQEEVARWRSLQATDDQLVALRQQARQNTERAVTLGTADANALVQDIAREHQARTDRTTHQLQLLQAIYQLRNTHNHE